MGIRTFTFNGESSDTYGILITQNASFNAPERAGEMLSIPGRNGAFWQDYGRFENIEVTYHCVVGEGSKADFVQAMSDVRSWLCSPIGYCRLEDDYNPSEYRMAVYKSGLETDEPFVTGAEFEITFECKPQRFLKSGETAVSVTSGDTITNPTRFDAQPLLQTWGYGDVNIGSETITLDYRYVGMTLMNPTTNVKYPPINMDMCNSGDDLYLYASSTVTYTFMMPVDITSISITASTNPLGATGFTHFAGKTGVITITFPEITLSAGVVTTYSTIFSVDINNGAYTGEVRAPFMSNNKQYGFSPANTITSATEKQFAFSYGEMWVDSTLDGNGTPTYIDLDVGEAYIINNGVVISVNNVAHIPAELPTLPTGATKITYDNTFTQVDIVPRWWSV